MNNWTLQDIWNETLLEKPWAVKPRDYMRASEIGTSMVDRYLRMKGVQPTNPFDARVLRVFEVGNLYEWLVRIVLIRSGLLIATQTEIKIEGENHLPVIGHLDFIGGGKPNFDEANKLIPILESIHFPKRMMTVAEALIKDLSEKYPDGLPPLLYEIKSINSMVFWRKDKILDRAYDHHIMQLYTYLKGTKMQEGRILYISKDDLTVAEFAVIPDADMEAKWQDDVSKMTKFLKEEKQPPLPPQVAWNIERQKYEVNWMIARSSYFDLLIKQDKKEWERLMGNLASRANARVKKIVEKYTAEHTEVNEAEMYQAVIEVVDPYVATEFAGGMTIKT